MQRPRCEPGTPLIQVRSNTDKSTCSTNDKLGRICKEAVVARRDVEMMHRNTLNEKHQEKELSVRDSRV